MEIKKIEKCDYVMFPRLQEQGVESRHVEREAFRAELKHVEGHGDYWLVYQQAPPHLVANIQFAEDEAEFDRKLGWFIGQQKLHEYVRGDLSFISALAGYNHEEVPMRFPDNIKSITYALSDSARWWHLYGLKITTNTYNEQKYKFFEP
jgi:hypothetical protein